MRRIVDDRMKEGFTEEEAKLIVKARNAIVGLSIKLPLGFRAELYVILDRGKATRVTSHGIHNYIWSKENRLKIADGIINGSITLNSVYELGEVVDE